MYLLRTNYLLESNSTSRI